MNPPPGGVPPPPVRVSPSVGPEPVHLICTACHQQTLTTVKYKPSTKTHLIALLLCLLGCCPCVVIPYCVNSCQNVEHYCSNCNAYIGTYSS